MDRIAMLWDVAFGQPIGQPFTGHISPVYSLVFAQDGNTLVSAENEIIVWNLDPKSWLEKSCQRAGRNFSPTEWVQYFPDENIMLPVLSGHWNSL
jgi:WD40 repeat protein